MQRQIQTAHAGPYADRWDHLEAELALLDTLLRRLVEGGRRSRPRPAGTAGTWGQGFFIGDDEVDGLLEGVGEDPPAGQREAIRLRVEATLGAGVHLPLVWLAQAFALSEWEVEVLMLCLAPDVATRYERIYAYLQDDINKRRPGPELALALLGGDMAERALGRAALAEDSVLRRSRLVIDTEDGAEPSRAAGQLRVDPRIADILLGSGQFPEQVWRRLIPPSPPQVVPGPAAELADLARQAMAPDGAEPLIVALRGADLDRARSLVQEVCSDVGVALVQVDLPVLLATDTPFEPAVRESIREGILHPAAVLLEGADDLGDHRGSVELKLRQMAAALDDLACLAFVSSRSSVGPVRGSRRAWLVVDVPDPDISRLADRWQSALRRGGLELSAEQADSLASRYRIPPADIDRVVAATLRAGRGRAPTIRDVEAACRGMSGALLGSLAVRVVPRYTWEDIVLPAEGGRQLREIAAAVRSRRTVLVDWKLGEKLSRGKGLSVLFSGAPGTGKTMAAEIIASALGLDLYTVDLATVVSKYIGETEKNLSRIFDAAESTSALLFFDEADALFGRRSEVKDSHDRYANIEISYLLQRMETYDGLVVMATNLKRNLDEAFLRRLSFVVEFPFPDAGERLRIWRSLLPPEAPLRDDIDWAFLADRFSLAGGNIKGALMHAAYQAAAGRRPIGMPELVVGVRRELEKLGKGVVPSDFGPYWSVGSEPIP